jgi:hypothetical protein
MLLLGRGRGFARFLAETRSGHESAGKKSAPKVLEAKLHPNPPIDQLLEAPSRCLQGGVSHI